MFIYCLLDPLPPTDLQVTNTSTSSVTIHWKYNNNETLHIERWSIVYTETGRSEDKQSSTNAVDDRDMTINNLTTGMTYLVRMYAVSAGDISSRATSYLTATVGKFTKIIYLTTCSPLINCHSRNT